MTELQKQKEFNLVNYAGNWMIGAKVIEIISFPEDPEISENYDVTKDFRFLLSSLSTVTTCESVSLEIVFATKATQIQVYEAEVITYMIVRAIGKDAAALNLFLEGKINEIDRLLSRLGFRCNIVDKKEVLDCINFTKGNDSISLVKRPSVDISQSPVTEFYYSTGVLAQNNDFGLFEHLFSTLSKTPNVMISFSVVPKMFSDVEKDSITKATSILNRISEGFPHEYYGIIKDSLASKHIKMYNHYSECITRNTPMFDYLMTITGDIDVIENLSHSLHGLLNYSHNKDVHVYFDTVKIKNSSFDVSLDFNESPWKLSSLIQSIVKRNEFWQRFDSPQSLFSLQFRVSLDEATCFFWLPVFGKKSISGVKVQKNPKYLGSLNHQALSKDNIPIGFIEGSDKLIGLSMENLSRSLTVVGMPRFGKSALGKRIIIDLVRNNIPFLVIEPSKSEYRTLIDVIPDLNVFTPGNKDGIPFIFNPFVPPKGVKLQQYKSVLMYAFESAFQLEDTLSRLFRENIEICYEKFGWRDGDTRDDDVTIFGLTEFVIEFRKMMENMYDSELRQRINTAGIMRIKNFMNVDRILFDTVHSITIDELMSKPTVLELDALMDPEHKSLIISMLLASLIAYTKATNTNETYETLRYVILLEEAHVLLSGGKSESDGVITSKSKAKEIINTILLEMSAYGIAMIIADQSPQNLTNEVIGQTRNHIMFHTEYEKDREILKKSCGLLDIQTEGIARLQVGEAYVKIDRMEEPVKVKTIDLKSIYKMRDVISDKELNEKSTYWKENFRKSCPYIECQNVEQCRLGCNYTIREESHFVSKQLFRENFDDIKTGRSCLEKQLSQLDALIELRARKNILTLDHNRLLNCAKLHLFRLAYEKYDWDLSLKNRIKIVKNRDLFK